jgi:putative acetyltransferase
MARTLALKIRAAKVEDLDAVLDVETRAFGEPDEAELVRNLLADPSAEPLISLLAFDGDKAIGHILFTAVKVVGAAEQIIGMILAPLAVVPEAQGLGVGDALSREALAASKKGGVDLVFVLGHPGYYPRFGFAPAGQFGLSAPYPIPAKDAGAWMVLAHRDGLLGNVTGTVQPADMLMRPEYWRE